MRYLIVGFVIGIAGTLLWPAFSGVDDANTRELGIEWVNNYHGWASTLAACDDDAQGFYNVLGGKGLTKSWNWGDDNAWEEDFKSPEKPGGGNDATYADNVDFAYFSGHGNKTGFYFGVTKDDTGCANTDAVWGDKDLDWIALSSCQVLNYDNGAVFSRWGWPVFKGLHLVLGMHTNMSDTPNQGTYLARFMTGDLNYPSYGSKLTITQAWRQASWWALPSDQWCAILGVASPDTWNDYLPGYGPMAADNNAPSGLWYIKYPCG